MAHTLQSVFFFFLYKLQALLARLLLNWGSSAGRLHDFTATLPSILRENYGCYVAGLNKNCGPFVFQDEGILISALPNGTVNVKICY